MNLFLAGGVLLAGRDVGGCVGGRAGSCGGGGCGCPVQLADSVVRSLVLDDLERMQSLEVEWVPSYGVFIVETPI